MLSVLIIIFKIIWKHIFHMNTGANLLMPSFFFFFNVNILSSQSYWRWAVWRHSGERILQWSRRQVSDLPWARYRTQHSDDPCSVYLSTNILWCLRLWDFHNPILDFSWWDPLNWYFSLKDFQDDSLKEKKKNYESGLNFIFI